MIAKRRISNAEWLIMNAIWEKSPVTAKEIIQKIASKTSWNPKTIKSLINRLVMKKKIGFTEQGRNYLYHPLTMKIDCIEEEQSLFLDKTFENSPKEMIISILEKYPLSASDLDAIRTVLESKSGSDEKTQSTEEKSLDVCLL